MASLIGPKTDLALAEAAALAGSAVGVCVVANDNNAGNIVISGDKAAVDLAIEAAKALGARAIPVQRIRAVPLPADAAGGGRDGGGAGADQTSWRRAPPSSPTSPPARPSTPTPSVALLVDQVTGRVRWRESMTWMVEEGGVTRFAEAGAGKALTGMARRIAPDSQTIALNTPADLEAFAKSL